MFKNTKSNILAANEEIVIQSLTNMRDKKELKKKMMKIGLYPRESEAKWYLPQWKEKKR